MNSAPSANLQAALARADAAWCAALAETAALPAGEARRTQLQALATLLVGSSDERRSQALQRCPDLAAFEPTPDARLQEAEQDAVALLGPAVIACVDGVLLASAAPTWRPAARVLGEALVELNPQYPGLPLGLYAQRVAALVGRGELEARGNPDFMRLCELRRAAS